MFSGINILDFRGSSIPRQTIEAYLATDYSIWGSRRLILRVGQRNHDSLRSIRNTQFQPLLC